MPTNYLLTILQWVYDFFPHTSSRDPTRPHISEQQQRFYKYSVVYGDKRAPKTSSVPLH